MVELESIRQALNINFVRLIAAVAILLLGLVFGRFLGKLVQKILHGVELNRLIRREAGVRFSLEDFIGSLVKYAIYLGALIFALNQIGLTKAILYVILIILFILIVIFIIFAFKDFIPNLVAGIYIHQKKIFLVGDTINIKDIEGKILKTDLTETVVITKDKDTIFIPNSIIIKYKLIKKGKNQKI